MKHIFLTMTGLALSLGTFAQRYNEGGVSIRNARGERNRSIYHKLQIGVLLPGTMPARKNVWYSKTLDPSVSGTANIIPLTLQYAWSSNVNTEFLIHAGFEQIKYYSYNNPGQSDHTRNFASLLIGVNYKWWQQKYITLYSGLLIGGGVGRYAISKDDIVDPTFETDRTNWAYPSAQLTAIGANFGQKVGGFCEIAFGSKGIVNGGVYWRF